MALNANNSKVGGPRPRPAPAPRPSDSDASADNADVRRPVPAPRPPSIRSNPTTPGASGSPSRPQTVPEEDEEAPGELYIDMRDANIPQNPQNVAGRKRTDYELMQLRDESGDGVGEYLAAKPVDDRPDSISEYIVAQPIRSLVQPVETYESLPPTRSGRSSTSEPTPPALPPARPLAGKTPSTSSRPTRHDAVARPVPNEIRLSLLVKVKNKELDVAQVEALLSAYEQGIDLPPEHGGSAQDSQSMRSNDSSSQLQDAAHAILEKHRQGRTRDSVLS